MNHSNHSAAEWCANEELLLRKLHAECLIIFAGNQRKIKMYGKLSTKFNVPIIAVSSINGLFAVSLQKFVRQDYISIINAVLSLITGVLSSVYLYMKIGEKMNIATQINHELIDLTVKIFKELSLPPELRENNGKSFVDECFTEYTNIMKRQPIAKHRTVHFLAFDDTPTVPPPDDTSVELFALSSEDSLA